MERRAADWCIKAHSGEEEYLVTRKKSLLCKTQRGRWAQTALRNAMGATCGPVGAQAVSVTSKLHELNIVESQAGPGREDGTNLRESY
jgi:hypothetical protein